MCTITVFCAVCTVVLGGGRAKLSGRAAALPTAGWPRRCCQVQLRPVQTSQPRPHPPAPAGAAGDRRGLGVGEGGEECGGSWCCPDAALTQIGPGRSGAAAVAAGSRDSRAHWAVPACVARAAPLLLLLVTTNLDGKYTTANTNHHQATPHTGQPGSKYTNLPLVARRQSLSLLKSIIREC